MTKTTKIETYTFHSPIGQEGEVSDDKGAAENTDKVVHVFKREGAGMFAPQDIVSITAQGGLTICVSGLCITKRPEDWHAMAAKDILIPREPKQD